MSPETYLAYLITVFIFFAHPPGPSQVLFIAGSLRHGLRGALPIGAGDLSANALQILAAGFGLAALVTASAELFTAIKWLGVAYLVWLGLRMIRDAGRPRDVPPPSPRRRFMQGFLTSAANPYAVVFFAALFPQFLNPAAPLAPQIAILGLTYLVIDGSILVAFGAAAQRLRRRIGDRPSPWPGRLSGLAMIVTAGIIALRGTPEPAR